MLPLFLFWIVFTFLLINVGMPVIVAALVSFGVLCTMAALGVGG